MTSDVPSGSSNVLTWLAVGLCAVLLLAGIVIHGFSLEIHQRFWTDMFARFGGPMTFRFFLQPAMATIAAVHDGITDSRGAHKSFFWSAWLDSSQQTGRLREGLASVARILLLGISMDVIYQLKVLGTFYPAEAAIIAIALAAVPYFVMRWIVEIIARHVGGKATP